MAAVMALGAFRAFAKGDIEDTKADLLRPIGGIIMCITKREETLTLSRASRKLPGFP